RRRQAGARNAIPVTFQERTRRSLGPALPVEAPDRTASSFDLLEHQAAVAHADSHPVAGAELPLQDVLRQRILDLLLDGPLERAGAVYRIEARLAQEIAGR